MEASPPQPPDAPRPPEPPQPPTEPAGQWPPAEQAAGQWPQAPTPGYDSVPYGTAPQGGAQASGHYPNGQPQPGAYPYGQPPPGPYGYGPPPKSTGFPVWAIVLIVAAVLVPVMGILAAIAIPTFVMQRDRAKDSSAKEGAHAIQVGIQSWAVDHGDLYPQANEVTADGQVGSYMQSPEGYDWPTNPWTGRPMGPGTGEGDYEYLVSAGGTSFTLIMHLSGGQTFELP